VNWSVLRREWGAVTFVLTVLIGVILVPVALYLTNQSPHPLSTGPITTVSSARASGVASPTPSASAAR
jgi:maltodextrin utilization protein YvdJ